MRISESKVLGFLTILILSIYTIYLYFTDKLSIYIHPRYFNFTLVMAIISGIFSLLGSVIEIRKVLKNNIEEKMIGSLFISLLVAFVNPVGYLLLLAIILLSFKKHSFFELKNFSSLFVIFFLLVILILPPKTLGSFTFDQRSIDLNSLTNLNSDSKTFMDKSKYTMADWIKSKSINPNLSTYESEKVDITGFVFKDSSYPENVYLLARFVVTCCAVDARPIGIYFENTFNQELKSDEWLRVQGKFKVNKIGDVDDLVILPEKIEKISQPRDPYIY